MFENEIRSERLIEGTPDEVWGVLSDFSRYDEWNPGFEHAEGQAKVGAKLRLTFAKEGGRGMTMRPTVKVADPGRELRWLGRLGSPFIFDGEHRFQIEQEEPGRVRFIQSEIFRGVLVPFLRNMIEIDTLTMFGKVNAALAARVSERRDAA
jgi:hypothetical protein